MNQSSLALTSQLNANGEVRIISAQSLTDLGGYIDGIYVGDVGSAAPLSEFVDSEGVKLGLENWLYAIEVAAQNEQGLEKTFTLQFEAAIREKGVDCTFSGYELTSSREYGDNNDESQAFVDFFEGDTWHLNNLREQAEKVAKAELAQFVKQYDEQDEQRHFSTPVSG